MGVSDNLPPKKESSFNVRLEANGDAPFSIPVRMRLFWHYSIYPINQALFNISNKPGIIQYIQ